MADLAALLQAQGVASTVIATILNELRFRWGGESYYIPRHDPQRRAAISADPGPPKAVAQKHGVSPRTVYRIRREWPL